MLEMLARPPAGRGGGVTDDPRSQLQALAGALGAASRAAAALAELWPAAAASPAAVPALLTVAQLAEHLGRSRSAVRGWCEQARFRGAFKLNGKDWRIPAEAVASFVAEQAVKTPHRVGPGTTIPHMPNARPARRRARATGDADLG